MYALRAISALIKKPPLLDLSVDQIDLMTGDQASEWTQIVSLLLWANDGGGTHAFAEYCAWPGGRLCAGQVVERPLAGSGKVRVGGYSELASEENAMNTLFHGLNGVVGMGVLLVLLAGSAYAEAPGSSGTGDASGAGAADRIHRQRHHRRGGCRAGDGAPRLTTYGPRAPPFKKRTRCPAMTPSASPLGHIR